MKYLKRFETEADIAVMDAPNVVFVEDVASVLYNVEPVRGVFIQHISGLLYSTDQWTSHGFTNDKANGVAVITNECKFVIAKTQISSDMDWSSDIINAVDGVVLTNDLSIAKADYAGKANTSLIAAIDTSKAAYSCANFKFPNGQKGHLPALGEWVKAYTYKADINAAMLLINGTAMSDGSYWSSTQFAGYMAWTLNWSDGTFGTQSKDYNGIVRAFLAL